MRRAFLCTLSLLALVAQLRADWKIATAVTYAGRRSVSTEYLKGRLRRYERESGPGKQIVSVVDYDKLRHTIWDVNRREYVVIPLQRTLTPSSALRPNAASTPVLLVEIATTDPGERRTIFGREARHLISSEKRYRESDQGAAPVLESESLRDGWYVDVPGLPTENTGGVVFAIGTGGQMPIIKVKHTGPDLTGLAVRETRSSHHVGARGGSVMGETTVEVTELSEGSLAPELFEPPPGFQRVTHFPEDYRRSVADEIESYWEWFQDWVRTWFF